MNYDERFDMNEEARISIECQCEACEKWMTGYEALDPIEIEGMLLCDECASDLVSLRLQGYLKEVSLRTKKLVEPFNRKMDAELAEMIYPIRTVKHI